jgi:plasmid stabilization system protein ParE
MFRVEWIQRALDDLASIWSQCDSTVRQRITRATNEIDKSLTRNPYRRSEARSDDSEKRVLFEYPIGAIIEIDLAQRVVWVIHVWRFRHRGEQ